MNIRLASTLLLSGALATGLAAGGCFNGNQLAGLPCQSDDDCGPNLYCVGQPGEMICDEDPNNPTTDDVGDTNGTETGTADGTTESDDTTDDTDTEETETDTDTGGECQEPSGMCEQSNPPIPNAAGSIAALTMAYCQTFTQCGCGGFRDLDECVTTVGAQFAGEEQLAMMHGASLDPTCLGFRLAFLADLGCREERGINPPLATINACDWRNCPLWTGIDGLGSVCEGGNPITSSCAAPLSCDMGTCIDACLQIVGEPPPIWVEEFINPEAMCSPMEHCSVCSSCNNGMCSASNGSPCAINPDCGPASFCNGDSQCEPRRNADDCCDNNDQCLSEECDGGRCVGRPYVCEMPFPHAWFEFPKD